MSAGGKGGSGQRPRTSGNQPAASGRKPAAGRTGGAGRNRQGGKPAAQASAREVALDILMRVEQQGAYSNLLLGSSLQKADLSREDTGLVTELVYGTLSRMITLDYVLSSFVSKGMAKLEPWVRSLLRLSLYQIMYLDRVPSHAAVNEAVNISKRRGHQGISGMVNGVLRSVLRAGDLPVLPEGLSREERISILHSHPLWMVKRWSAEYGPDTAEAMCTANNEPPAVSVRVNTTMISREAMLAELLEAGLDAAESKVSPAGLVIRGGGNLALTSWYRDGYLSVQDESSMLVAEVVAPEAGMKVLDCCAAPGGKSAHMGELMKDEGSILANDLHEHKAKLIAEQAARLGLECITTASGDALELGTALQPGSYDRILLDAPCSGLGVIRRKPDLKWRKQPEDIVSVAALQLELLQSVSGLLKPGGVLVYSTCTTEQSENSQVVAAFLERNPGFAPVSFKSAVWERLEGTALAAGDGIQLLPHHYGSDGFYIARLERLL
ncbi:16S rRNA (cytosine(967)-C(5))-methyltransferase RsmB [Paenibacillus sp. FSL R7-0337]|uniref:16S rRNA (cytosine(967)-C(5))-methyltransferase RsmB n=2 Tax=Paenibacillus TaxID=44249 RepID=UPI00096DBCE6|nr:16S rRNA (cytosine(967)-C(5))-methyltransferase RsmB [Paenibacillus sp. FSL R7-0337]OMF99435.1 16S rRNA (cytosine(967)-C(5))-methyltransferase [Paenibacillus sp. FSL R7-0337]